MTTKQQPRLDLAAMQRLQQISLQILGQLDIDRVLESILEGSALLLDASQVNLYRYLPERDCLATWIPYLAPEGTPRLELARGEGAAGAVLARNRPIKIDDYDRWAERSPQWPPGVTGAAMAVPVRREDELLGVITTSRRPKDKLFTAQDLELFQLLANQAAVAIANAQLYARVARRADELSRLYATSLDIVSQLELTRVLHSAIERATELLDSQSANLRMFDPAQNRLVPLLPFRQARSIASYAMQPGEGLSGRVFATGEPLFVNDYDGWEGRSAPYPRGLIQRAMAAPLREGDKTVGVLVVERSADRTPFNNDDLQLLSLFANQVSIAITNSHQVEQLRHLHAQQIEKERIDQQVRTARAVQAGLLPIEPPGLPGWDVAALWRPALELGGDYYDHFPIDADRWAFVVADVSDKGIPAALLMAVTRSLFRVYAKELPSPASLLARLNTDLVNSSHSGMFVTAICAVLEPRNGLIRISAAGHPPALHIARGGARVTRLGPKGMPLGILLEARFEEVEARLEANESLVLYTDGITEANRSDGDMFGLPRLQGVLQDSRAVTAPDMIRDVDDALRSFVEGEPPSDDVACLVVRRNG